MPELSKYLAHIGISLDDQTPADLTLLKRIVRAHLNAFSYQNTEIFLQGLGKAEQRTPSSIGIADVFERFVSERQPGYCFQNGELLAWALDQLEFKVTRHLARPINLFQAKVDESTVAITEMVHEALVITLDQEKWLVDTGFANNSLRQPLKIAEGEQMIADDCYLLTLRNQYLRLNMRIGDAWYSMFDVDLQPKSLQEVTEANINLFTHPQHFPVRDAFYKLALVNDTKRKVLCVYKDSHLGFFKSYAGSVCVKDSLIDSEAQLSDLAQRKFGITVDDQITSTLFPHTP